MTATESGTFARDFGLFVDGAWREAKSGKTDRIECHHPGNGQRVSSYVRGGAEDVDMAVKAANRAFRVPLWAGLSQADRAALLARTAESLRREAERLAAIEADETGKPFSQSVDEIQGGADLWQFAAASLLTRQGFVQQGLAKDRMGLILREPVGVVGLILPWNYPFVVSAERLPFILASGCTVVVKPSEYASGTALLLGEILKQAGLPDGVYNVVTGLGEECGAPLVDHPGVAMISFTGSTINGKRVMGAAARGLKRVSLELGGKSPIIVFADADLEQAADAVIIGFTRNAGQNCIAASRLLVERAVAPAFKTLLCAKLARMAPLQPLTTDPQYEKVKDAIARAKAAGYAVAFEGNDAGMARVVAPVVFESVPSDSFLAQEEIFGPVLAMISFDDENEAVALANDTPYGLAGCVWTSDLERGMRIARRIRAGRLWINAPQDNYPGMPVGGYGASGIGREAGGMGIDTYSEVKSIILKAASDSPAASER